MSAARQPPSLGRCESNRRMFVPADYANKPGGKPLGLLIGANRGFDEMSKLYSVLLLIASLFAMAGLGMLILVAITEIDQLIAPTNNPSMMKLSHSRVCPYVTNARPGPLDEPPARQLLSLLRTDLGA